MSSWQIEMLGGLIARSGDTELRRFRTRQAAALLAYLVFYPGVSRSRDELGEMLWPEAATDLQRRNLRQAIFFLRRHLEPADGTGAPVILSDFAGIRIDPATVQTDVAEFERLAASSSPDDLITAVPLYRGPLLASFTEEWIEPERQRLRDLYIAVLRRIVREFADKRDFDSAIGYAHRAIQEDPYREESHRALIQLYVATGRAHAARDQVNELKRNLAELGIEPSRETMALVQKLPEVRSQARRPAPQEPAPRPQPPSPIEIARPAEHSAPLPIPLTRLFGRDSDRLALADRLEAGARLITLIGPGGVGKTRLALETIRDQSNRFKDGAWFVQLADIRDPSRVPDAVLLALKVDRRESEPAISQVAGFLADRSVLLVLDNYEQLLPKAKATVLAIVRAAQNTSVIVTSRTRLGIDGESLFEVRPLDLPTEEAESTDLKDQPPAVQMFVDRAQSVRADFRLTFQNFATVSELTRKLEGLPLAIELAAARMGSLTVSQILTSLEERFRLLATTHVNRPQRHRSLWAAVAWSVDLLASDLRQFFSRLSVFRGGFNAESAAAVALKAESESLCVPSQHEHHLAMEMLDRLRQHSLIVEEEINGELRYSLLETIREFGEDILAPHDTADPMKRHAMYFAAVCDAASDLMMEGSTEQTRRLMDVEYSNMLAALSWSTSTDCDPEPGYHLAAPLAWYWQVTGRAVEGRARLEELDAIGRDRVPDLPRASLLSGLGNLAMLQDDLDAAFRFFDESRRRFASGGDEPASMRMNANVAAVLMKRGRLQEAEGYLRTCVDYHRSADMKDSLAGSLNYLGHCCRWKGDLESAIACWQEALAINRSTGHREWICNCLQNLGNACFDRNDIPGAKAYYSEAMTNRRELGDTLGIAYSLQHAALIALEESRLTDAQHALTECHKLDLGMQSIALKAWLAILAARLSAARGQYHTAARLLAWFNANCNRQQQVHGGGPNRVLDTLTAEVTDRISEAELATIARQITEETWDTLFSQSILV